MDVRCFFKEIKDENGIALQVGATTGPTWVVVELYGDGNRLLEKRIVTLRGERGKAGKAFLRYVLLCIAIMLLSAGGTWLLGKTGMSSTLAKMITDAVLYFASYHFQERWVFRGDDTDA